MRIFQFDGFYPRYLDSLYKNLHNLQQLSYAALHRLLINDRFNATHILEPALDFSEDSVYSISSDQVLQDKWAHEKGLKTHDLREILLAQIEDHRTEVLYAMDLGIVEGDFFKRLPGCVKKTVCFHGGPETDFNFAQFDLCLSNHPIYLRRWRRQGLRVAYFGPSHDPVMSEYANNEDRPIDVVFAGSCSGYHLRRLMLLNEFAALGKNHKLHFALIYPRFRPWLNVKYIRRIPSPFSSLPEPLRELASPPAFGRGLYQLFSQAKIVLNVIDDVHGVHRANMRCFEALGSGGCMLSDEGIYPEGMRAGEHFVGYQGAAEAVAIARDLLANPGEAARIGRSGAEMLGIKYSKRAQWEQFQTLVQDC